jgi:hypothetical protein
MAVKHFPMAHARALIAADPLCFGRAVRLQPQPALERRRNIGDDLWLFATTFAAGFLFISILIA